jgi:hypothetical protein
VESGGTTKRGARLERQSAVFRTEQSRAEQGPACVPSQHDAGISGYKSQMQLRGMARDRNPEKGVANPRCTFPALPAGPGPGPAACPWRRAEADNDIDGRLGITTHWAWSSWGLNIHWIWGGGCAIYHWPVDNRRKGGRVEGGKVARHGMAYSSIARQGGSMPRACSSQPRRVQLQNNGSDQITCQAQALSSWRR